MMMHQPGGTHGGTVARSQTTAWSWQALSETGCALTDRGVQEDELLRREQPSRMVPQQGHGAARPPAGSSTSRRRRTQKRPVT
jgi:hypothetical protein